MKVITAASNQTIYDLGVQHYGSIEGAKLLVIDNKLKDGLLTNVANMTFKIISPPINAEVVAYYQNKNVIPVSMATNDFLLNDFLKIDFQ